MIRIDLRYGGGEGIIVLEAPQYCESKALLYLVRERHLDRRDTSKIVVVNLC